MLLCVLLSLIICYWLPSNWLHWGWQMQTKGRSCFKRSSSCKRIFLWDRSDGEYFSVDISMETESLQKKGMLSTTVTRNILPKIKDFFFGGDPGNWGIFWGPYEPSSKCGHGCLGQVAYQNISIFMSQDLWRFSEPIDLWYPWQWSYLWGYLCLQYLLLFLPSSLVQVKP